ncbi:bumetanide-sensitive sodium-(potassium)-chloride cotransporter [Atheta coriaria]|uniref:bumetanide-sensitive sodium-(potassium)-chloride cotransporter n=1 Tax=Dalotia coriaria TaxID=877792 RepID=UPI0031F35BD5
MDHRFSIKIVEPQETAVQLTRFSNGSLNAANGTNGKNTSTTCLYNNTPKRKKSLVQLTREAFPRLENYRQSKRALKRPSLGELHGGDDVVKDPNKDGEVAESQSPAGHGVKLGWIQGVLIPCLLNIWGVMLFLRLSWVVAQSGIGMTMVIIAISAVVCVITTLSLSAISTNGEVKGGGIYYIISRSLGPEFGASVGVVFAFANAVAASMNTIGFCDSLNDLLKSQGLKIIDNGVNDVRIVGCVALLIMIIICAVGMEWESKAQNFLIAIIVGAIVDFLVGTAMGPGSDEVNAQGFSGFSYETFSNNWAPDYRTQNDIDYNFFQVFAIFFPSVTGIQAGANISGDLKDPASSIPKGTMLALAISMFSYALFVVFAGGAAMRDASGNVTDLINGTLTNCTSDFSCKYGLFNSYSVMQLMSAWGPFIYAGCFAATLSTALTNLLSVPRLLQALGIDRIYPGLIFFSKGYGKSGEPYRGYVLTFFISSAFVLIADLNAIAPLISNFYLASYALINFCTFHAALIKPLGWRPTFKYYNTWLSLCGFFMCVVIMFLINWQSSLITFIVILALYLIVVYRKPDVNWGSSTQAQTYKSALATCHKLNSINQHVKNYEPQILLLCGSPQHRPPLLDFANLITKNNALLVIGEVLQKKMSHRQRSIKRRAAYQWFRENKVKAFYSLVDDISFELGAKTLMQTSGIGKLTPNVLMMGFKSNWRVCSTNELTAYFEVLHSAFDNRLSVAILRTPEGLDFSRILDNEEDNAISTDISLTQTPSRPDLHSNPFAITRMVHADSNLNISNVPSVSDSVQSITVLNGTAGTGKSAPPTAPSGILKNKKKTAVDKILFTTPSGKEIPANAIDSLSIFKKKQGKGVIDVWWLYDDGGLTMLLPYIISCRQDWESCKLRVFSLAGDKNQLEIDKENMSDLLKKFRLNHYSLEMLHISDRPQDSTIKFFDNLLSGFTTSGTTAQDGMVTELELAALQDKTYRHLRLRELLLEKSKDANLVVMSLPMPRKGTVSARLYMAWLETLTKDLPPYLLVRGNQQSVLTFYS